MESYEGNNKAGSRSSFLRPMILDDDDDGLEDEVDVDDLIFQMITKSTTSHKNDDGEEEVVVVVEEAPFLPEDPKKSVEKTQLQLQQDLESMQRQMYKFMKASIVASRLATKEHQHHHHPSPPPPQNHRAAHSKNNRRFRTTTTTSGGDRLKKSQQAQVQAQQEMEQELFSLLGKVPAENNKNDARRVDDDDDDDIMVMGGDLEDVDLEGSLQDHTHHLGVMANRKKDYSYNEDGSGSGEKKKAEDRRAVLQQPGEDRKRGTGGSFFGNIFGGSSSDLLNESSSRGFNTGVRDFLNLFGRNGDDHDDEDDDFLDALPEDSFSLMMTSRWCCSLTFAATWVIYAVQVGIICLMLMNLTENSNDGDNPLGIPANVTSAVRITQAILLSITALTQDTARTAIGLLFKGYTAPMQEAFVEISLFKFIATAILRISEGTLGVVVTFIFIIDATEVIDLILNFTAIEFVSQLDEIFFGLAAQGFLGKRLRDSSEFVRETKYEASTIQKDSKNPDAGRERRGIRLHIILFVTWLALMAAWIVIMVNQTSGEYLCQSFQVQFEDDFVSSLGAFSGIYDIDSSTSLPFHSTRVRYIDRMSGKAAFAYCLDLGAWTFSFAEDGHFPDPCEDWVAHSDHSETFDILETQDHAWIVRNPQHQEINIDFFHMECMDCDLSGQWISECNGHGACSDAVCQCDEGRYGLRCEFEAPCTELEMDVRFAGFEDEREWSRNFQIFEVDGHKVNAYSRPVYVHEPRPGTFDIVVFTGRRWMATHTDVLLSAGLTGVDDPDERRQLVAQYFSDHFHAYWSDFVAAFITTPLDIGTEDNAATPVESTWLHAKPKSLVHPHEVQQIDHSFAPLDSVLLCSVCNNDTNICLNDGQCVNDLCDCLIGSFGSLCQIPPTGNGRCDPQFDVPKYDYDGGDCCESTCVSGDVFHCGKDETGYVDLGYFFCIHEFDEWHLNEATFEDLPPEQRYSIALSSDGHILTLGEQNAGHVSLYDADGSVWDRRGPVLVGPLGSNFGSRVAMSKGLNGTVRNRLRVDPVRLAVNGRIRDDGFLRIYECLAEGCTQSGEDITFSGLPRDSRTVHDISKDGRIVAFGGFNETRNSTTVLFYHYEEELNLWTPKGIPELEFEGDAYSLALSGSFDTLAIRSIEIWEGIGHDEFHRKFEATDAKAVFHFDSKASKWEQFGHTIYHHVDGYARSPHPDDFHILDTRHRLSEFLEGSDSISLSDDGMVMAAGFPFSKHDPGVHVYAFDVDEGEWVERGHTISDETTTGFKGWSVALSGDGDLVIVGTGGDETATNTYRWLEEDWVRYGQHLNGGAQSSLAISSDGSVLAVAHDDTIDVFHRNIKPSCADDLEWFHLSLTLDSHPEDTRWDVVSNATGEVYMSGGPYAGAEEFPYKEAYARSTIVVEVCLPRDDCKVFSVYDKIDPLTDEFTTPDGLLDPGVYELSVDGIEVAKRRLDQAVDHIYIGESCQHCPEGTHALKVLVRSCVPFYWTLKERTEGLVLFGDNSADFKPQSYSTFLSTNAFSYARDGTCQNLDREVHTYWKETCVEVGDLDHDCFDFDLVAHPDWNVVKSAPTDAELDHAHRNSEVVLLFDDEQITVDLALVGSLDAGPPSEIHYQFGGACDV